jgi:hypothetical protein
MPIDPNISLQVRPANFDLSEAYLAGRERAARLRNLASQEELRQEQSANIAEQRRQRETRARDQAILQQNIAKAGGSIRKALELSRGQLSPDTQMVVEKALADEDRRLADLNEQQFATQRKRREAFAGLVRSAQGSEQAFRQAVEEARRLNWLDEAEYARWSQAPWNAETQAALKGLDLSLMNAKEAEDIEIRRREQTRKEQEFQQQQKDRVKLGTILTPETAAEVEVPVNSLGGIAAVQQANTPKVVTGNNYQTGRQAVTFVEPRTGSVKTTYTEPGTIGARPRQGKQEAGRSDQGAVFDRIEKIKDVEMRFAWRKYEAAKDTDPQAAQKRDEAIRKAQAKYEAAIVKAGGSIAPQPGEQAAASADVVTIQTPDGRVGTIPRANLAAAKARGAVEVK